jgi:hypothetical protein
MDQTVAFKACMPPIFFDIWNRQHGSLVIMRWIRLLGRVKK